MAGIFGFFDYNRPGPGVPKDAPPKPPVIVFFEILQRKFWNLIKVNMLFLVFNIPALVLGMFVMLAFFPTILPDAFESADNLINDTIVKFILLTLMMCVPMITTGPAQAGFTYVLRNYAREEHAFIWGDFKEHALKNLKQSLAVSTINFFATFVVLTSIRMYWALMDVGGIPSLPGLIGLGIMVMVFIVFACMNIYIYPMMVTFDLNLKQLYKNAFIFAVIKFLPNLGILLLNAFIVFLTFGLIIPFSQIIGFFPYIFLTLSLTGLITNFYAYSKLKKFMLSRVEEDDEEEEEDEDEDEDEDKDEDKDEDTAGLTDRVESDGEDASDGNSSSDDGIKRYY
jgi:uncharacterized membrane protein YesL